MCNGERRRETSASWASDYIAWLKDKVLSFDTMEYRKCVKCLAATFDGSWKCAQKWLKKAYRRSFNALRSSSNLFLILGKRIAAEG